MNASTLIVLSIIVLLVILDIKYLRKNGISGCSGDCTECGSTCKFVDDVKKAQRKMRFQRKIKQILHIS